MKSSETNGPRNRFPGDLFLQMQRDPLEFFRRHHELYPDIYRWTVGPQQVWVLSKPDLVERLLTGHPRQFEKGRALQRSRVLLGEGLLTAEGDKHLRYRRLMQPAFRKTLIAAYGEVMAKEAGELSDNLQAGSLLDLHKVMMDLALTIVGRTLLGVQLTEQKDRIAASLEDALGGFRLTMLPFFEQLLGLPIPQVRRFKKARAELQSVVDEIVRQAPEGDESTLLGLLEGATHQEKADQVLTILLAGHETTANALTFAFYLLAKHPEVAERFHAEVRAVLGDRRVKASDYGTLITTRHIVQEVLRLYPPAWMVGRRNLVALDWEGHRIPAKSLLLAPQWVLHRDPRFFSDPLAFRPERWQTAEPRKGSFFPFGGGTRVCIGEGFARLEAVLILAELGRRWRFRLPDPDWTPQLVAGITLRPAQGLPVTVHAREQEGRTEGTGAHQPGARVESTRHVPGSGALL